MGPDLSRARLRVRRELREHAEQRMRNRLVGCLGRSLEERENGLHGHAVARILDKLAPLHEVAAHLDQPPQRVRVQVANQPRGATAQRQGLGSACRLQLLRDL